MGNVNNMRYAVREALHHIVRHGGTTVCAVVSICLSLLITGMFAVGSVSLRNMLANVEESIVVRAFVDDAAAQEALDAFQADVSAWPEVEEVTFTTKEQALEDYKANMGDQGTQEALDALEGQNPLPASFKIRPADPEGAAALAAKVQGNELFAAIADGGDATGNVSYGQDTVDRLLAVAAMIRNGAIIAIAVLTVISFTFINNTIRMSIATRDKEIRIMRLVGASNGFIRGPFVMEGIIQAFVGAVVSILALELVRNMLFPKLSESLPFLKFDVDLVTYVIIYAAMAVIGILVGVVSSSIAIKRFLKE